MESTLSSFVDLLFSKGVGHTEHKFYVDGNLAHNSSMERWIGEWCSYICCWKFSHKEQMSFDRSWILLAKTAKSCFVPTFEGLKGNVHGSSVAHWKARGPLPISVNCTFFTSSYGWGAMRRYWSKSLRLKGGWVTLSTNFRRYGDCPPTAGLRKLESMRYHMQLFAWSYI